MKFTKEEVLEELKAKLTQGGRTLHLSERTISENLENLIPLMTDEDTEKEAFIEKAIPLFNTWNKNVEKEKADFIKSYKPEEKTKREEHAKHEEDQPDPLSSLKDKLERIEAELEQKRKEEVIASMTKKLKTTLKSKGVKDDEWIDNLLPELNITEDFNVEDKAESYVKLYNKANSKTPFNITPFSASGEQKDLSDMWDDIKPKKD